MIARSDRRCPSNRRRGRGLIWASAAAGALGAGLVATALTAQTVAPAAAVRDEGRAPAAPSHEPALDEAAAAGASEPGGAGEEPRGISALVSAVWVAEAAPRLGIPERALAAYAGAAMRVAGEQPGCGVDWQTLAGIGHVESGHGTIFGGAIAADGRQHPAIIGIALDGTSTDTIPDTDRGALDGDPVWDRAVGPMQIIPDTWRMHAADGDGDGATDPQQIDDAALTAARYLCATGADLRTDDGWISAIGAYNDTVDYNHRVAAATTHYRTG